MKYSELKRSLINKVEPVYILCGSDDFLRNHGVTLIKNKSVSMPDLNFMSSEGSVMTGELADTLFSSLRSYPFLSEKRMVLIKEYYPTADELKKYGIADYLSAPSDTSVLVISNRKECKALEKFGAIKVDCVSDMALCVGWISNEAKKAGLAISPQAAVKIAEYCLLDFTKINTEVGKLTDYCAQDGEITISAVTDVVHKDSEYQIYEMVECIVAGKADNAYGILSELLSKNESEQKLFISVYSHFRRMLHIAMSDKKNSELAEILGVKEYSVKMTRMQLKRLSVKKVKAVCEKFAEYDARFKAGDLSLGSALWNGVFSAIIGV